MDRVAQQLHMWSRPSDAAELGWPWVQDQLVSASTYWVVSRGRHHPHPRPVWGLWNLDTLFLSIGSPRLVRELQADPAVTINLGSDTDVVIVEGHMSGLTGDAQCLAQYNAKYEWNYTVDEYGPLTAVTPTKVIAWRSEGWAGRDGIKQSGRWRFAPRRRGGPIPES